MLQVRNVPEQIHRTLKSRAAAEGLSPSDYMLREMRRIAERPTRQELNDRIAAGATLVTCDLRLASATGHGAEIAAVSPEPD